MPRLLGLIGTLVVFAGLDLLWQSRQEIFYWLETWRCIFRSSLRSPRSERPSLPLALRAREGQHLLRMLLGIALVLFLGPFLIVLGLSL